MPRVSQFLNNLGITHKDIIKHCNGTLKLGITFEDFNQVGESFTFPFGLGEDTAHNSSSINHIMKKEQIPEGMFEYPDIATHFRTTDLCNYMDTLVGQFDNLIITRKAVAKFELAGTYDLLVDCTGFGRYVSYKPDNFKDIQKIIPNNKAFSYRCKYTDRAAQQKPYSLFKAMDYGWIWHIALGDQLAMGYVHDSKYSDIVKADFIKHIENKMGVTPDKIDEVPFRTGRNHVHLKNNVVAVGLASAFIEPLESTGLYLVVSALEKLAKHIDGDMSEEEYNNSVNSDFDTIVEFIVAHYKYSKRGNEYWNHYKTLPNELYRELDIFPKQAWSYVLNGFDKTIELPKEKLDPRELINIHRGTPYYKWIQDASNFK